MRRQALPLPFIWLHQVELRNALRLRVFRKEITGQQRDASINAMLADLAAGVLETTALSFTQMMTEAERLSALHSEQLGTRSLDILHVASAIVIGTPDFLTFDLRRGALAKAAGLNTPNLLKPLPKRRQ